MGRVGCLLLPIVLLLTVVGCFAGPRLRADAERVQPWIPYDGVTFSDDEALGDAWGTLGDPPARRSKNLEATVIGRFECGTPWQDADGRVADGRVVRGYGWFGTAGETVVVECGHTYLVDE